MKTIRCIAAIFFLSAMNGCASLHTGKIAAGATEPVVIATLGTPTHRYQDGKDHLLEYMHGPWGQQTYMARISPEGKLLSYEQVLTSQKFASIKIGQSTREDVLRTIGAPSETVFLPLSQLEVWSYPYKESGIWDSMMHVHFDKTGVVRMMLNGPDPRRTPDDAHWPFGMLDLR